MCRQRQDRRPRRGRRGARRAARGGTLSAAGRALLLVLGACGGDAAEPPADGAGAPVDEVADEVADGGAVPVGADAASATQVAAPAPADDGRIVWTGCDISKTAYMAEAVAAYEATHDQEIIVTGGGATRGIRATVGGMSDLGGTCRHTLEDDFPEDEGGALLTHVAWDALVFFTHPDNEVDDISREQAKAVLRGEITDWSELGGEPGRIKAVFRQQTVEGKLSGVGYMTRLLLFDDPTVDYTSDALFLRSSGPVEQFVEETPGSFAVTGISSALRRDVKRLSVEGVEAEPDTIASGDYPLVRPLYLVTRGEPTGPVLEFLDWMVSDAGQAVLEAEGTVSLAQGKDLAAAFPYWPDNVRNR